jgi:predicted amidohydrolase
MTYQVIAAAQAGIHNDKRESYGDTLIIDPWGTIVGRLPGKTLYISHIHQINLLE